MGLKNNSFNMTATAPEAEIETIKKIELRHPENTDGYDVNQLVKKCKPLDENSVYCNLLQCHHFGQTSMCAMVNDELQGFVSGYIIPQHPDTLFIWQVAVSEEYRGQGLAIKMIDKILAGEACSEVKYLQTTVTKSNLPSWRLFEKLARLLSTEHNSISFFNDQKHFHGEHESEELITIGPF